jgi:hypothetical protein
MNAIPVGVSCSMTAASASKTAFQREVASRFGLVPHFFSSAADAPEVIERLWTFAKAGYLDSRFCEVRYCIARHCAFLVGRNTRLATPLSPSKVLNNRSSF